MRRFYERFLSVRRLPVPVVAAVNGAAIGAGMCLALACDLRVVASSARLGFTFVGLGLHPVRARCATSTTLAGHPLRRQRGLQGMGSTHYLPTVVGHQTASRLLLTGETITGEEAVRIGLAVQHVPQDHVLESARQLAKRIAANGPVAVRSAVRTLRSSQVSPRAAPAVRARVTRGAARPIRTADSTRRCGARRRPRRTRMPQRCVRSQARVACRPGRGVTDDRWRRARICSRA